MKEYIKGIWRDRYILENLVKIDLKQKYRNSILGVLWSIITPIGLVLIIGTVYSIVFGIPMKEFIPSLFTGLIPWIFLNSSIDNGTMSFIIAEGYLKQTNVNPEIFPLRMVIVNFINFIYSIVAFIFLYYIFLKPEAISINFIFIIPALIIVFLYSLGLANIVSIINLKLRDFQHLQALILQGLFYITPIIYPVNFLKDRNMEGIYLYNPFYYMIEVVKLPLLGNRIDIKVYYIAFMIAVIILLLSIVILAKQRKKIVFDL